MAVIDLLPTKEIPMNANETAVRLLAVRSDLIAQIWPTACKAAQTGDHECVRDLVKLKVDIEAIDFALSHRPAE
ncbi:MAG: hypothetical protein EON93_01685 [Burkholderiales bacterium]|nr:MAG: hypothetical protein EON93_01685 [Burkholderiales bacterium]